jgi:hypothetical protein
MPKKKVKDYGTGVSQQDIEALARCLLPEIEKYFESEAGKREFIEWKEKQKSNVKIKESHI